MGGLAKLEASRINTREAFHYPSRMTRLLLFQGSGSPALGLSQNPLSCHPEEALPLAPPARAGVRDRRVFLVVVEMLTCMICLANHVRRKCRFAQHDMIPFNKLL